MKKKTFMTMYWIGTLLFCITLPPIEDVYLWHGVVLTCLASGWAIIALPPAVKQYKEFTRVTRLYCKLRIAELECKAIRGSLCKKVGQEVWDNFWIFLGFTILVEIALAVAVVGIGIICVKCC